MRVIGRLKPGVTVAQAQADMNHVLANIGQAHPDTDKGRSARVMPLTMLITGNDQRQALWIMAAGVVFVLLIACVDVAVMLLARGVSRQREMAIRTALGAGRVRIIRQILLENLRPRSDLGDRRIADRLGSDVCHEPVPHQIVPTRRRHSAQLGGLCGSLRYGDVVQPDLRPYPGEEDVVQPIRISR